MTYEIPIREMAEKEVKNAVSNEFRQIVREELNALKEDLIPDTAIRNTNHLELLGAIDDIKTDILNKLEEPYDIKDEEVEAILNKAKEAISKDNDTVKDAYHTMDELYHHRTILFASLCSSHIWAWKSKKHSDGTEEDGWFIAGIETNYGQITYHQKIEYWDLFKCEELESAPKYDGHTPDDVIDRLIKTFIS